MSGPEFDWRLRQLMAMRDMFATSDLISPLADRGIELSRSQVYRLVTEPPERISLSMLLALVDILECQLADLAAPVEPGAGRKSVPRRRAAAAGGSRAASKLPPSSVPRSFYER